MKTHDIVENDVENASGASRRREGALSRTARKHSLLIKILIIAVLLVLLLWPTFMLKELVN